MKRPSSMLELTSLAAPASGGAAERPPNGDNGAAGMTWWVVEDDEVDMVVVVVFVRRETQDATEKRCRCSGFWFCVGVVEFSLFERSLLSVVGWFQLQPRADVVRCAAKKGKGHVLDGAGGGTSNSQRPIS